MSEFEQRRQAAADRLSSSPAFVPDHLKTAKEREWGDKVAFAIQQADEGNWQPGIDIGLFPEDAGQ